MKKILSIIFLGISSLVYASPTEVVIPFPPGGGVDIVFKNLQAYAAKKDVKLVPSYKSGADGLIAANDLLKGRSSHRLGIFPASTMGAVLHKDSSYQYTAITGLRTSIFGIAVRNESHIRDLDDLSLKIRAGTNVILGYGAPGQLNVIEQYLTFAKSHPDRTPLLVPYKGAAPVIVDLLNGTVDVIAIPLITIDSQVAAGKMRLIATVGKTSKYPQVPSVTEVYREWKQHEMFGVIAPSNMPKEEVVYWSQFLKQYLEDKEVQESFERGFMGQTTFGSANYKSAVLENVKVLKSRPSGN
jgi:tripartite-type tricarboxylate transporter receptor subunit TctC